MRGSKRSSPENNGNMEPVFRQASNGLWLITLVPCALMCGAKNIDKLSPTYLTVCLIGVGLLVSSLYTVSLYRILRDGNLIPRMKTNCILSSAFTSALVAFIQNYGLVYSSCVALLSVTSCCYIFEFIVHTCPRSFTYGEVVVVSQSLILYLTFFVLNTISSFHEQPKTCEIIATYILQAGYFIIFLTSILAFYYRRPMQQLWIFITTLCSLFFIFAVYFPYLVLRINSLLWILELINDQISIGLIIYWLTCCVFCIYCLWKQAILQVRASSTTRKNFHFAILFVLVPGLVFRPCLMYLASGIGFAILVVTEIMRKLRVSEFSNMLQTCFDVFKDEKDEGSLALTPLYLMLGCVMPLWIYPTTFENSIPLPVLSGVLSIAVGDTAASICGIRFGKVQWPGTAKTLEGTVGCVLSQMAVLFCFEVLGIIPALDAFAIYKCFLVIIATSLVEATTDQIDNLVLPLVSYILFMLLFF